MTIEQLDPNSSGGADHISDWLHDSVSFLSSFMDDPYDVDEINGYQWWDQSNDQEQNLISPISLPNVISPAATTATTTTSSGTTIASSSPSNPSKKRKSLETDDNDAVVVEEEVRTKIKRSVSTKKSSGKMGSNCNNAFKGRECEFRRIVEGEAAMALVNRGELNEAKDKWCERIGGVGFSGEGFGEDAIDGGRALLRKYDSNWEMRVDEKDGFARLWWKGQPVSFCSLWTLEKKAVSDS
ncbi:hypothetical protein GIB67_012261 [Kingdonia uniflora]|uniref:Transcription factor n=1 Tax=Kingdonia uniflora TaxID=39325 RepID=A0A7J7LB49_9MAGN|nr:hypothetical protein GIB67_012261 [Kingdonia uniflora]